jgi:hypothetical protein
MSTARFLRPVRSPRPLAALVLALALFALAPGAGAGQTLPDVDVALVLQVRDVPGWLALYTEVLGTSKQIPKLLGVSVDRGTGGRRSLLVSQPKFEVSVAKGAPHFKVVVHGKVSAHEALSALLPFQLAVVNLQAAGDGSEAVLSYGLSSVVADLVEFYVVRP